MTPQWKKRRKRSARTVVTGMTFFEELKEIDRELEIANRKDDDMTTEELHAQTNAKIVEIIERIEALEGLNERVDNLKQNLGDMFSRLDSKVDKAIGRLDVMDQVNASANAKIEKLSEHHETLTEKMEANRVTREAWSNGTDAAINVLQSEKKIADEMRGDVEMCKGAIRDLDSIRDSATRAANQVAGFEPRLSQMEETVAAIQTLRHHDDSPRPDGMGVPAPRSDGG